MTSLIPWVQKITIASLKNGLSLFFPFDVVIFMEQWMKEKRRTSALAGAGMSLLCLLVFGAERFIPCAEY